VIDGYDEAPSCSSFASGSFDIDVIFHVHCTKPVWCVTPVLAKMAEKPKHHPTFSMGSGLIHTMNSGGERVLCIPRMRWKGDSMTACIIDHVHKVLGHLGVLRTADYICRWYWWPGLGKEVLEYKQDWCGMFTYLHKLSSHQSRVPSTCQVRVYSSRGSSQVRTKSDEGREQRAGQGVSLAGVGDRLDSTTKDNER